MVYCGKPSKGCQMCRTRRIKCDEAKPTCNQCTKSRRVCPGYKDDFDLVFRNETQATERRARRAVNSKRVTTSFTSQQMTFAVTQEPVVKTEQVPLAPSGNAVDVSMTLAPFAPPDIAIDQQAPCYFVSNYVLTPRHSTRGYFDFLIPMLKNEGPNSHLSLAFSAVSLAALSNRPNTRGSSLFHQAIGQYAKALKALNLALQNTAHQKTDQTLASIIMLGFFETVCSEKTNAMAWYSHVDGAVQLVKMRGKKQLRTKVGYSLFACVRTQMIVSCMSGSKVPSLGSDWWVNETAKYDADVFITLLNMRVAELRAEINDALANYPRTPEYFQEVLNLMKRAQAMEQEYLAWESRLPAEWLPRTVAWVDQIPGGDITKAEVCPGKVDMYGDIYIASTWNQSRVARLFISGAIVRCAAWVCSPVDYRTTPEYATAVRLCSELITEVIASIPYHLGWRVGPEGVLKGGEFTGYQSESDGFTPPKAIGGFFCMWPLFSISNTDYISDSQRQWAKGRLVYIAEQVGLNHAKVLSNFQLRLPSMIIRRDAMVYQTSMHALSSRGAYPFPPVSATMTTTNNTFSSANPDAHVTTNTINSLAEKYERENTPPESAGPSPVAVVSGGNGGYSMNPLQQRDAMQRDAWEKERRNLIKKAGNGQGDSVERLTANYLAV